MRSTRREFLGHTGMATMAMAAAARGEAAGAAPARPRNIVFILTDDQRYDAMGCLGHPFLETPHLDALARGGAVFPRAFVTTALCSPSRASILSGLYAHRHGVLDNNTALREDTPIFPQLLQRAGYRTAFIGKWHMGGASDAPFRGFDRWVSFRGQGVYENPTLNIDGAETRAEGYITDLLADHAVDFIGAAAEQPFFLFLAHKAVHAEFRPAPRHRGCYADKTYPRPETMADTEENYRGKPAWVRAQRSSWHGVDGMYNGTTGYDAFARQYAETMRAVDDGVGRVAEALRARGLLDSTLIVFTSDNGFQFGEHGLIDKRTMYEASYRVPLVVHCPEIVRAGSQVEPIVANVDFAPTLLEAAGVPAPAGLHGRSFLPLLRGEDIPWRDGLLYTYFWERDFPQTPTVLGIRTQRYKLMQYHGVWDRYEMYDLEEDPHERNNLLGPYLQKHESGTLDRHILAHAEGETKRLFKELHAGLMRLLDEAGCAREPRW